ncbi:hypothetical protein ACQKP7_11880 [Pseudomonas frederiksbergensis]|uniref:hypothetical protein n=1 Tax=Pseudomonas frederiksbergensis TaxID=104087 RepID=UPI003CFDDA96
MQAFTYDNVTIEFEIADGVVVSSRKLREPRKYVEGECWIRTAEGDEQLVYLGEDDLQFRLGQEVTLIYASSALKGTSFVAMLRNHSVAQSCVIEDGESLCEELVEPLSKGKPLMASILMSAGTACFSVRGAWRRGGCFITSCAPSNSSARSS